jgi:hypothetical protein
MQFTIMIARRLLVGMAGYYTDTVRLGKLISLLLVLGLCGVPLVAHDIAADVKVQAYVKPEGSRLRIVLRVPVKALHRVDLPLRAPGFLKAGPVNPLLQFSAAAVVASEIEIHTGDARLPRPKVVAVQASLDSDRSFVSYADALAYVTRPPVNDAVELSPEQAVIDMLLEYPLLASGDDLGIWTHFERLGDRVVTVLWFLPEGGTIRAYEYLGDAGLVRMDPTWHQAALRFVELGFEHILSGIDHLLFLFCLVIPFRKFHSLLVIVTAFTVAHSITLIASAFDLAPSAPWFPPLIEVLIATSIVYMAVENIVGAVSGRAVGLNRRWMITFGFGLVHGFGFSFALREMLQFAGSYLVTSLLAFNVGVELGQLLVVTILILALWALFRRVNERVGSVVLSGVGAMVGGWWMVERFGALKGFGIQWVVVVGLLMVVGVGWVVSRKIADR